MAAADVDDDPFAEPAEDTGFLSIYVLDVARQDERKKLIAAMRERYSQEVARLLETTRHSSFGASINAMEVVLFGVDWVTEPLP